MSAALFSPLESRANYKVLLRLLTKAIQSHPRFLSSGDFFPHSTLRLLAKAFFIPLKRMRLCQATKRQALLLGKSFRRRRCEKYRECRSSIHSKPFARFIKTSWPFNHSVEPSHRSKEGSQQRCFCNHGLLFVVAALLANESLA